MDKFERINGNLVEENRRKPRNISADCQKRHSRITTPWDELHHSKMKEEEDDRYKQISERVMDIWK